MKKAYLKGIRAEQAGKGGLSGCPYEFGADRRERQWANGYIDSMLTRQIKGKTTRRVWGNK